MNLIIFAISILICVILGIVFSYFTQLDWLPAALLVYAALYLHAVTLTFAEARCENSQRGEDASNIGYGMQAVWFWLRSLGVTLLTAGMGAYLQINH